MVSYKNRELTLLSLLKLDIPVHELADLLGETEWDSGRELVVFNREHINSVLDRFVNKEISSADVEEWANLIEGREDINYEKGYEDVIKEIIFQLANPILTEPITADSVTRLQEKLF